MYTMAPERRFESNMYKATRKNKITGKIVPSYNLSHSALAQSFSTEKEYSALNNIYANSVAFKFI